MALALRETPPSNGEQALVSAVRRGEDRAFEQLFSRYRRRISGYVFALVGDHGRAEDITQEVFISALRRLRETDQAIAFKPWIYEIARNACIDEFRRARRSAVVPLDDEQAQRVLNSSRPDSSPEARRELAERVRNLFGAFSGLSENHHQILVLRELEGLSYAEIAERMGISRPVVESTLFRARRRLTEEYAELDSGRRCGDVRAALDTADVRSLARLGVRERRRIAGHLNHCEDCLRYARMAGVDSAALQTPSVARRVAALIPFGWLPASLRHARTASSMGDSTGPAVSFGRAIAAAAALFAVGGGLPSTAPSRHPTAPAPQIRRASTTPASAVPAPRHAQVRTIRAAARAQPLGVRTVHGRLAPPREPVYSTRTSHEPTAGRARNQGPTAAAGRPFAPSSGLPLTSAGHLGGAVPVPPVPSVPSPTSTLGQIANQVGSVLPPAGQVISQASGVVGGTAAGIVGTVLNQTATTVAGTTSTVESLQPPAGG